MSIESKVDLIPAGCDKCIVPHVRYVGKFDRRPSIIAIEHPATPVALAVLQDLWRVRSESTEPQSQSSGHNNSINMRTTSISGTQQLIFIFARPRCIIDLTSCGRIRSINSIVTQHLTQVARAQNWIPSPTFVALTAIIGTPIDLEHAPRSWRVARGDYVLLCLRLAASGPTILLNHL